MYSTTFHTNRDLFNLYSIYNIKHNYRELSQIFILIIFLLFLLSRSLCGHKLTSLKLRLTSLLLVSWVVTLWSPSHFSIIPFIFRWPKTLASMLLFPCNSIVSLTWIQGQDQRLGVASVSSALFHVSFIRIWKLDLALILFLTVSTKFPTNF